MQVGESLTSRKLSEGCVAKSRGSHVDSKTTDTEFEINRLRVEAEVRRHNAEQELSQEVHMFNQARTLIEEMTTNFSIEGQSG